MIANILGIFMGFVIIIIWTKEILFNKTINIKEGFFKVKDIEEGRKYWPHWIAEYITGFILVISGFGLMINTNTKMIVLFIFGTGALFYTSLNSLSWSLGKKERTPYTLPFIIGVAISVFCFISVITKL